MFQVKNVQTPDQLFVLAEKIHEYLKQEVHTDDIEVAIVRGHELNAYMANTGKMLADAKYWKDQTIKNSTLTHLKDVKRSSLPASILNELIKADAKEYNYLVNFIEQLDKECKHQLSWLITCVSKAKEEMKLSNQQSHYGNMD